MPATVIRLAPRTPDPATGAALAEFVQLGMAFARTAARLVAIEDRALDALAAAAAEATRAAAAPAASLEDAVEAGRHADAVDAARDAIAARVALVTECFDKAARAVRRTAALQARLADPRPFGPPPGNGPARPATPARRPANDREPGERLDRPETGDELGPRTDAQVLAAIRRDLDTAARTPGEAAPPPEGCAERSATHHPTPGPPPPAPDT